MSDFITSLWELLDSHNPTSTAQLTIFALKDSTTNISQKFGITTGVYIQILSWLTLFFMTYFVIRIVYKFVKGGK